MKRLIIGGIAALAIGLTSCTSPATQETSTAHTTTTQATSTAHTTTVTESPSPTKDPSDLDPATYQSISARDFAILVKDPDSARGRKIVIYGLSRSPTLRRATRPSGPPSWASPTLTTPTKSTR
jgi:hypothetical protein